MFKPGEKVINLDTLVQDPRSQFLQRDARTTEYLPRDCDIVAFRKTELNYIVYINGCLVDVNTKSLFEEGSLFSIHSSSRVFLYDDAAHLIYGYGTQHIKYSPGTFVKMYEKYLEQQSQRIGDRAIDGNAILQSYKIASKNRVCNSFQGSRDYVVGGSGDCVWLDTFYQNQSGVEYGYEKHLFTPAEYDIVSQMLHRKFIADKQEKGR